MISLKRVSQVCSFVTLVIALAVIAGWIFGVEPLKNFLPRSVSMKFNTALLFALLSFSSLYAVSYKKSKWFSYYTGAVVLFTLFIALSTIWQYFFNIDIGIDQLFIAEPIGAPHTSSPGRMALITAIGFVLAAAAITLYKWDYSIVYAQIISVMLLLMSVIPILGYVYYAPELYGAFKLTRISAVTALSFLLLGFALVIAMPQRGLLRIFSDNSISGKIARRLIPFVLLMPIIPLWYRLILIRLNLYNESSYLFVGSILLIGVYMLVAWWFLRSIILLDRRNRESESKVKNWEKLLSYVIKHDPNSIAVFDNEMRYVFVSERYTKDYGIYSLDLIGKSHYEVFPDIPFRWREIHLRALRGETVACEDDLFIRADGSRDFVKWECRPWFTQTDEIGGMILYSEVITKRKEAMDMLREVSANLKIVLENAGDGIFAVDTEGRATMVNRAAEKMLGYTEKELIGEILHNLHHHTKEDGSVYDRRYCPIYKAFKTGIVQRCDDEIFWRRDGSSFPVEYISTPLLDRGVIVGAVVSFRDISERKEARDQIEQLNRELEERVLERTEQLSLAIKELEAFSYSVSHDLRAPLRAIDGYTRILTEDYREVLDSEGVRLCGVIRDNTRNMGQLIDDLLSFSRLGRVGRGLWCNLLFLFAGCQKA